ncbi:DEAD/DEAH box helicase [Halochromatium salexigens]|uniref:Helicase SNF2 n=1 Tax=Halochromatium salexigens TaxID=49447 RepID=A0AAJ0XF95_HALSE|nr:DEAD/DEAH box helicase [Halochromatium salexigens]MBK5930073.1 helicase SNF2 [Halochromatium salexigens]
MAFDEQQLNRILSPVYVARGRRYAENGAVLSVGHPDQPGRLSGQVRGSGAHIYSVVVDITDNPGRLPTIAGHCTCPVGWNCKHVAALLLAAGDRIEPAPGPTSAPTQQTSSPALMHWLREAEQLSGEGDSLYGLLYLLSLNTMAIGPPQVTLSIVKVRHLKSGGYGKPSRFNPHTSSQARFMRHEDRRVIALFKAQAPSGNLYGRSDRVVLDDELGVELLQAVLRSGRGHWRDQDGPPLVRGEPVAGTLDWRWGDDSQLHLDFETEREGLVLLPLSPPWYLDPNSGECGPIDTPLGEREATTLVRAPTIPLADLETFEQATRQRLKGLELPEPPQLQQREIEVDAPTPCLRLQSREVPARPLYSGWHGYAAPMTEPQWEDEARLLFDYAGVMVDPRQHGQHIEHIEDGVLVQCQRHAEVEQQAIARLEAMGLQPLKETEQQQGLPLGPPRVEAWLAFMDRDVPVLEGEGWRVEVDPSFRFPVGRVGDWDLDIEEGEAGRWLDLSLGVEVDGERLDLLPILINLIQNPAVDLSPRALNALSEETRFSLRLDDGRYIFFPAERLKPILSTLIELYDPMARLQGDGRMRLSRLQATELAELEQQAPNLSWRGGEQARAWGRRLREFERIEPVAPPAELQAELRPYQQEGLNWLQFLRDFELGGVLADDMGLGKTIQALAHLLIEKAAGRADRPSLVVAPTSLMFNWKREAERFAPSLRVVILQGPKRQEHFDHLGEQDLVLTTYALLPRDLEVLIAQDWHLLILDEAQAIKNPRSKGAQAARALKARHRLCLTGTPLENHLGELWSLMDFLMPDLLGDERGFRRLFRTPIERHGEHERTEHLRRRIAPFLLRRTKEKVAADLPAKTEILREVALASDQRDLYETLRLALHEKVRKEIARKGLAQSGIIILDALLKLRQCCCDPRLVSLESARRVKGSAKLDLLMELLSDLLQEGRRVLLFSQFTSMLSLIEEALDQRLKHKKDRDYVKLTGQTRNRQTPVDRFQAGEVPLFLISLKAGGSGLNLTAADTVIHYDPWWNPAAERQATDRAHRIGQDKPVFVYKLLTEGTVEQRVAELQERKQALADAMLEGGGSAAKSLSHEDLDLLFAPLDAG